MPHGLRDNLGTPTRTTGIINGPSPSHRRRPSLDAGAGASGVSRPRTPGRRGFPDTHRLQVSSHPSTPADSDGVSRHPSTPVFQSPIDSSGFRRIQTPKLVEGRSAGAAILGHGKCFETRPVEMADLRDRSRCEVERIVLSRQPHSELRTRQPHSPGERRGRCLQNGVLHIEAG